MDFAYTDKVQKLQAQVSAFMEQHVYPNEARFFAEIEDNRRKGNPWVPTRVIEELKPVARAQGLWNLWRPKDHGGTLDEPRIRTAVRDHGPGSLRARGVQLLGAGHRQHGSAVALRNAEQQKQWLTPLLAGEIRSAFLMTEPAVASSDATNIECRIERQGNDFVVNGRKWWSSGAGDPRCKIFILMGKTDPDNADKYKQQSMILVPADAPGVKMVRALSVFGYDDAPHGHMEVDLKDVRVPASNLLLGEGRGFEIAQGRLGPGRIHHCMRIVGQAERALELMCKRLKSRVAFGKPVSEQSVWHERIAEARIGIDTARLLTLKAAYMMDTVGNKAAKAEIAMIKVAGPERRAEGDRLGHSGPRRRRVSRRSFRWRRCTLTTARLRLADGPDEVHRNQIGKLELRKHDHR